MPLHTLPNELLLKIAQTLSPNDIVHLASIHKHTDLTPLLKPRLIAALKHQQEPANKLSWACKHGHKNWVRIFLNDGAPVDQENTNGSTALHFAAICNRHDIITELLQRGADIEKADSSGSTALLAAVSYGRVHIVEMLVRKGANVNATYSDGTNALVLAASRKQCDESMLKLLLECGLDINPPAPGIAEFLPRQTALQEAVLSGSMAKTLFLLKNGADPDLTNVHGTALHIVVECIIALREIPSEVSSGREQPSEEEEDYTSILGVLLDHGAETRVARIDGRTPLHLAAEKGLTDVAAMLLKAERRTSDMERAVGEFERFNPLADVQDMQGMTALHLACYYNHVEMVRVLCEYESDQSLESSDNLTAERITIVNRNYAIFMILRDARNKSTRTVDIIVLVLVAVLFTVWKTTECFK